MDIDMGCGPMIWEMTVSIWSSSILIWDVLSLWQWVGKVVSVKYCTRTPEKGQGARILLFCFA